ncbi:sensor histidine kinase [Lysinibacter cavernae]|uniref:Sensor-like histidine kinase SenX3 n=1 Tax=Lysinibacter cavernae TaxID=1640652 RepID=A0A7X5R376_9MICO|nr:sensor histidine kinase [Lysinibacter cavernae]NIH54545.1 two-component system CitB family sensor kinase [Lysinibacter cavernae]
MTKSDHARLRFATRAMLLQLGTVALVVALCTGVYLALAMQQLRDASETSALNIARTLAEDPTVRELVTEFSADPGTPRAADLRDGELQSTAVSLAPRTGALFVVITDDHGIRLAHPDPNRLGQEVSTPYERVLQGYEVVDWEVGTLGESARAKVPIFALQPGEPATTNGPPVGEVSVGFERGSVFTNLPTLVGSIALVAIGSFGLATLAMLLIRRRLERVTLGLQPEELAALVQNQTAVLDGVGDGVIGIDPSGTVRVCNAAAERILNLSAPVGQPISALGTAAPLLAAESQRGTSTGDPHGVMHNGKVLFVEHRAVERNGRPLGRVVILRDRTDVVALSERLETVRAMTGALRVQRHEFANRIHVATGLIDADRVPEAREFLGELLERGSVEYPVPGLETIADPFLQAFLRAKAMEAGERGVRVRIADDSHLLGTICSPEDTAAVLGNLVDNAIHAAVRAPAPRWVEVTVLDDAAELVLTVSDSGAGVPDGLDVFDRADDARTSAERMPVNVATDEPVHGHGVGLPLSREIARATGGELWLVDAGGGAGLGAVFAARIAGAVTPPQRAGSSAARSPEEQA